MSYFVTDDNCKIYFETYNFNSSKPVIVLLNGTTQTTLNWKPIILWLKEKYRVLTYDARGQGKTDPGRKKFSQDVHTSDLLALLEDTQILKANLVGISHGANIALSTAAMAPEKVEKLMLLGIGAEPTSRSKLYIELWLELLEKNGLESMIRAFLPVVFSESFLKPREKNLNAIVKAVVKRNNRDFLISHFTAMLNYVPPAVLAKNISIPNLIVSSSEDPLVTKAEAKQLAKISKGAHLHIKGFGHSLPAENPKLFFSTITEFIK